MKFATYITGQLLVKFATYIAGQLLVKFATYIAGQLLVKFRGATEALDEERGGDHPVWTRKHKGQRG